MFSMRKGNCTKNVFELSATVRPEPVLPRFIDSILRNPNRVDSVGVSLFCNTLPGIWRSFTSCLPRLFVGQTTYNTTQYLSYLLMWPKFFRVKNQVKTWQFWKHFWMGLVATLPKRLRRWWCIPNITLDDNRQE